MNTLNLSLARWLKNYGMNAIEYAYLPWLTRIRKVARVICATQHYVTTDDLRVYANRANDQPDKPQAWGTIFKGKEWAYMRRKPSELPSNHGRYITVWKWFPKGKAKRARVAVEGL